MTLLEIADRIQTEADAYAYMEELRWGDGEPECPHCGCIGASYIRPLNGHSRRTRTGAQSERRVWRCLDCRKQFSVITGTLFHGTRAPLRMWIMVIFEMCSCKNGVAAKEISRKYGVCPRTAWFMLHRIREAMRDDGGLIQTMRGTIEADETFIGGDPKNRHKHVRNNPTPVPLTPSMNARTDKVSVLSLVNRTTGEVRSQVIPDVTGATLRKAIAQHVDMGASVLHTDAWAAYRKIGQEFLSHGFVDHSADEYVRGDVTTNAAEGFFSQLKRSIDGTHHFVSRVHLHRYLGEFDFRYSTRKASDTARMGMLYQQIGGRRLTYNLVKGSLRLQQEL